MGSGGVPSGGVVITYDRSLLPVGKPNSRMDRYKNGRKVQSRWYDSFGRAMRDRDFEHQGVNSHFFPHDHIWRWEGGVGIRSKTTIDPDYIHYI